MLDEYTLLVETYSDFPESCIEYSFLSLRVYLPPALNGRGQFQILLGRGLKLQHRAKFDPREDERNQNTSVSLATKAASITWNSLPWSVWAINAALPRENQTRFLASKRRRERVAERDFCLSIKRKF